MRKNLKMFCYQCAMSSEGGCGAKTNQKVGTCLKTDTQARLQDLMVFGLKGLAAYREHINELGGGTKKIDNVIARALYFTMTNVNFDTNEHINQLMKIGRSGVKAMNALSSAHVKNYGIPTPVKVTQNKAKGKAILVSGHNLSMMEELLIQTKNKGINVYTHSEMLPALAYPGLKKYKHLKGNIGGAWHDQTELFEKWPGAIIVNTNCIVPPPKKSTYSDRLFGYKITGAEGIKMLTKNNFTPVIEKALSLPFITGFDSKQTITTGHHYLTVSTLANDIISALQKGQIRQFFVIAGCDMAGSGGNYYREMAEKLPKDCVIITSSCGKFRFNDIDFGNVPGTEIPRYLDLGQCNDSNGAVNIALALGEALDMEVNELPIAIVLSWMEQKAVIILLALLSLGIKDIYVGPKAPQFVNEDIYNLLHETFGLTLTTDVETDLEKLLIKE